MPVVDEPKPGLAIIIGDSPQAEAAGLSAAKLPPGGFEVLTTRTHVLIVGDDDGLLRAIDAFVAHFLSPDPGGRTLGTDLVIAPVTIRSRPEPQP